MEDLDRKKLAHLHGAVIGRRNRRPGPHCPSIPLFSKRFRDRDWNAEEIEHQNNCEYCQWTLNLLERMSHVEPGYPVVAVPSLLAVADSDNVIHTARIEKEEKFALTGTVVLCQTGDRKATLQLIFPAGSHDEPGNTLDLLDRYHGKNFDVQIEIPGQPTQHLRMLRVTLDNNELKSRAVAIDLKNPLDQCKITLWYSVVGEEASPSSASSRTCENLLEPPPRATNAV